MGGFTDKEVKVKVWVGVTGKETKVRVWVGSVIRRPRSGFGLVSLITHHNGDESQSLGGCH